MPTGIVEVIGLPSRPLTGARRPDTVGQVLFLAGGATLTFALTESRTRG